MLLLYITSSAADFINQLLRPLKAIMVIPKNLYNPSNYSNL